MEASAREIGNDRAAQVRALLVVGEVLLRAGADDEAGVVRLGIMEDERAADRDRLGASDAPDRRAPFAPPCEVLEDDPELPDDEGEAREDEELGEVAAGHELVLRPVDREVVPPLRLVVVGAAVGRHGEFVVHRFSNGSCRPTGSSSIAESTSRF